MFSSEMSAAHSVQNMRLHFVMYMAREHFSMKSLIRLGDKEQLAVEIQVDCIYTFEGFYKIFKAV